MGNRSEGQEDKSTENDESRSKLQMSAQAEPCNEAAVKIAPQRGNEAKDYLKAIGVDPSRFWPKKYRFSREKPTGHYNPLTISQRNFYETNGYIVLDGCVDKKSLDLVKSSIKTNSSSEEMLIDTLLMRNDKLSQYVKCFCDESLMLMTYRLIDSFQRDDLRDVIDNGQQQRQVLSRDWIYLPFRPIDKVCCTVTAIEPLEHVLLVVPGTHRIGQCTISSTLEIDPKTAFAASQDKTMPLREVFECSPERLSTLVDKSEKGFKYVDLKPGQTIFYHPGLIHGFNNDLTNFRKSQLVLSAYFAAADCEYVNLCRQTPGLDGLKSGQMPIPIGLTHFDSTRTPIDYTSWLEKPRLISNRIAKI